MYRSMAEAYGWTPDQVGNLTDNQIKMYLAVADKASRADDWSKFGLVNDDGVLRGPDKALYDYMDYRRKEAA